MPKAQLTFPIEAIGDKGKKLKVAAHFSGVSLAKGVRLVDEMVVETIYKDAQSLVKMCLLLAKVEGTELDSSEEPKTSEPKPDKAKAK